MALIGVRKEAKTEEYRVGATPMIVFLLHQSAL